MNRIVVGFLVAALVYGIVGIALGLIMAISRDHGQIAVHAHVNLIGWVSFFLFFLFYRALGDAVPKPLALVHFWLAQVSAPGLFVGVWLVHAGETQYDPLAAISSLAYGASFLVFAAAAVIGMRRSGWATSTAGR